MLYNKLIKPETLWSLKNLPSYLIGNNSNTVSYYSSTGELIIKNFSQVHDDVLTVIEKQKDFFKDTRKCSCALIMGEPSYQWMVAALACFYQGIEVISFPETLNDLEAHNCLKGVEFSFCFLEEGFEQFSVYQNVPKLILNEKLLEKEYGLCYSSYEVIPQPSLVAFTSGTTSSLKLKAFRIDTRSSEHFFDSFTSIYELTHQDKWVVCHSFSHIVHFEYILSGLAWGINLAIAKPLQVIWNCKILKPNVLVTVPAVYQQFVSNIKAKLPTRGIRAKELEEHFSQEITEENIGRIRNSLLPEVADIVGNQFKMLLIGTAPSSFELKKFIVLCGLPLYEGYGMSETNMLTCNTPMNYRLSSVGIAWPGVKIKIENNELKAQLDFERCRGYINASDSESNEVFEKSGWVNTGDISETDGEFVFITGRSKDTIITDRGKNINPNPLEEKIKSKVGSEYVVMYGDDKPFLIAVISFNPEKLPDRNYIDDEIAKLNNELGEHERIENFVIVPEIFSIENGMVTRSGKVRRKLVWEKYKKEIEECYA